VSLVKQLYTAEEQARAPAREAILTLRQIQLVPVLKALQYGLLGWKQSLLVKRPI